MANDFGLVEYRLILEGGEWVFGVPINEVTGANLDEKENLARTS